MYLPFLLGKTNNFTPLSECTNFPEGSSTNDVTQFCIILTHCPDFAHFSKKACIPYCLPQGPFSHNQPLVTILGYMLSFFKKLNRLRIFFSSRLHHSKMYQFLYLFILKLIEKVVKKAWSHHTKMRKTTKNE